MYFFPPHSLCTCMQTARKSAASVSVCVEAQHWRNATTAESETAAAAAAACAKTARFPLPGAPVRTHSAGLPALTTALTSCNVSGDVQGRASSAAAKLACSSSSASSASTRARAAIAAAEKEVGIKG